MKQALNLHIREASIDKNKGDYYSSHRVKVVLHMQSKLTLL